VALLTLIVTRTLPAGTLTESAVKVEPPRRCICKQWREKNVPGCGQSLSLDAGVTFLAFQWNRCSKGIAGNKDGRGWKGNKGDEDDDDDDDDDDAENDGHQERRDSQQRRHRASP